jgi:hypothetical protein
MPYKVQLAYFRSTGKFLTYVDYNSERETLAQICDEVHDLRRGGRLPGLRPNAGRDLFILVEVVDHPERLLPHLVMPPFVDNDDITPVHVSTGELARTTTRDIVKVVLEEATPVDKPIPRKPLDEP